MGFHGCSCNELLTSARSAWCGPPHQHLDPSSAGLHTCSFCHLATCQRRCLFRTTHTKQVCGHQAHVRVQHKPLRHTRLPPVGTRTGVLCDCSFGKRTRRVVLLAAQPGHAHPLCSYSAGFLQAICSGAQGPAGLLITPPSRDLAFFSECPWVTPTSARYKHTVGV